MSLELQLFLICKYYSYHWHVLNIQHLMLISAMCHITPPLDSPPQGLLSARSRGFIAFNVGESHPQIYSAEH